MKPSKYPHLDISPESITRKLDKTLLAERFGFRLYYMHSQQRGYYLVNVSESEASWLSGNMKDACKAFNKIEPKKL